jgi:glycosyltransferase involved in cell wall biosynthesis
MNNKIPVSVVVMTKNEERNIAKCLRSLSRFDEVFVVDSNSEDRTREIAKDMGAEVVRFAWNGKYPKKKQWCLENLPFRHDWVLYVDADEEPYPETAEEMFQLINKGPRHNGYLAGYDYVFAGKVLKHGHRIYKLVLFNRHKGRFLDYDDLNVANMWEVEGHYQPKIEGATGVLKNSMLHEDHDTLYKYFVRHNRYSDWEAVVRTKNALLSSEETQPVMRRVLKRIFHILPLKGLLAFVHSYLLKLGFLDGRAGFHYALARGFYYWQVGMKIRETKQPHSRGAES